MIDYLADSFAGADTVVNAAGLAAPDQTHQQSLTGANALLPVLVALAAHRTGVRPVIHMSSASVQADAPMLGRVHPHRAVLPVLVLQGARRVGAVPAALRVALREERTTTHRDPRHVP